VDSLQRYEISGRIKLWRQGQTAARVGGNSRLTVLLFVIVRVLIRGLSGNRWCWLYKKSAGVWPLSRLSGRVGVIEQL
jgi:hypothetical protein